MARSLAGAMGLKAMACPVARASVIRSGDDSPVTNAHASASSSPQARLMLIVINGRTSRDIGLPSARIRSSTRVCQRAIARG